MQLLKKLAIGGILLSAVSLCADWDASAIQENPVPFSDLCTDQYIHLKQHVFQALANSWCSAEKANLLMDLTLILNPKVCVEIGACTGSSVLPVAAVLKHLDSGKIFAIDAWSNQIATRYLADNDPNKKWWSEVNMNSILDNFISLIQKWEIKKYCIVVIESSEQATHLIPDNIDFLHLDGDHSEKASLQDVKLYLPKVRSGGYILLSNFYTMVNREQPKVKCFCALFESCELVASIEKDNAVLFKKN